MAKKRGTLEDAIVILALMSASAIAVFLSYLTPAAIILLLIYYEFRARGLPKRASAAEFASSDDIEELTPLHARRFAIRARLREIDRQSAQAGLSLRIDGQFDARNPLGREFNRELEQLTNELKGTETEID